MEHQQTWNLLKDVNLSGIAIMAAVDAEGGLHKVGNEFEKLLAVARERSVPRIHTVVVAEAQRGDIDPSLLADDPHAELRVICAGTMAEAITQIKVDADTRWGKEIIDCTLEIERHKDFVGRHWLQARVQTFIDTHTSGYLLLTGRPGVGKSAFVAAQVRQDLEPVVRHFIKRDMPQWDDPEAILRSLTAQLRRKSMPCLRQSPQAAYTPEASSSRCWDR